MMLAGKTGLAIFPAKSKEKISSINIRIKHFAFNVDKSNFKLAIEKFKALKIPFSIQDHYYFNSIYVSDLDGHEVELTTHNDGFESFYK